MCYPGAWTQRAPHFLALVHTASHLSRLSAKLLDPTPRAAIEWMHIRNRRKERQAA